MDFISEDINNMIKYYLKDNGLEHLDDIRFNLSYSQGDGVAFYGGITIPLNDEHPFLDTYIQDNIKYLKEIKEYALRHNLISKKSLDNYIIGVGVKKCQSFYRYNHYNTIKVYPFDIDLYDLEDLIMEVISHISDRNDWQLALKEIFEDDYISEIIDEISYEIDSVIDRKDFDYYDEIKHSAICYELKNHYLDTDSIIDLDYIAEGIEGSLRKLSKKLEKEAYNILEEAEKVS